ncbi:MAG: penicillin-binding protein 2, partial [bacterium]|nr:penicillin-binding protein 2 [bacterium]
MEIRERKIAKRWMLFVATLVVLLFACVLARLIKLHCIEPQKEDYEEPDYSATYELLGLRGRILDRNGYVLAESVPGRVIYIDRKDPKLEHKDINRDTLAHDISELLKIPEELISDAFYGKRTYRGKVLSSIRVGEISDNNMLEELRRRTAQNAPKGERIAGVNYSEQVSLRVRPNGPRLSHVLGFINAEGEGVYGIEQRFNSKLSGSNGRIETMVDARRREIRELRQEEIPAQHGHDIVLTIDKDVQYIIESALSKAIQEYNADSGMIIVQKVDTGEILGMATLPSFPPEKYGLFPKELWKNIAISRNYEPGSVMKPLIVAMAIEHGIIKKDSVFNLKTPWYYAGRPLSDHIQPGPHDIRNILAKSSNIGTALIGLEMSKPNARLGLKDENHLLWASFRALGFGQATGIDLVGEERGILPHYSKWSKLSPTRMPIGQGIAVTGIQLCTAYSALANGGKLMRPLIVLEERVQMDPNNLHDYLVAKRYEPEVRGRPFSAQTGKDVLDMLTSVVEKDPRVKGYPWSGGTGRRAQLPSYVVAGKTGTAQIPVRGRYTNDYNASFVGIYPATNPQITILVTIERPKGARHTGGN